jgi:hypothetical protein
MKSYTTEQLQSSASPLYLVSVVEDNGVVFEFNIAADEGSDLDALVREAYVEIKNPMNAKEPSYKEKRQSAYPSFTDYLDGIVKGDQAQIQAYIDACKAVKVKYPKE